MIQRSGGKDGKLHGNSDGRKSEEKSGLHGRNAGRDNTETNPGMVDIMVLFCLIVQCPQVNMFEWTWHRDAVFLKLQTFVTTMSFEFNFYVLIKSGTSESIVNSGHGAISDAKPNARENGSHSNSHSKGEIELVWFLLHTRHFSYDQDVSNYVTRHLNLTYFSPSLNGYC